MTELKDVKFPDRERNDELKRIADALERIADKLEGKAHPTGGYYVPGPDGRYVICVTLEEVNEVFKSVPRATFKGIYLDDLNEQERLEFKEYIQNLRANPDPLDVAEEG